MAAIFILSALAVYRIARMVALEIGPFGIFMAFRSWIYRMFGGMSWVFLGIECPLCVGFWIALPFGLFGGSYWWLWWLAIAGLSTFLQKLERDDS